MSGKRKKGAGKAAPRAYGRLTRHERDTLQRMLERGASCRQIARELGRSPSTVCSEVASHRFVTAPRERRGERVDASADLSAACPRLAAWPRCCNGCGRYRAIGCKRRPHVFYDARAAQLCADSVLVSSRRGIDADEPAAAEALALIRAGLGRGLSPAEGRLQAEEARTGGLGHAALAPQVVRRVPRPGRGRVRRRLGDGHRRGRAGGQRLPAHAAAPPQQAAARAAARGEGRRERGGGARGRALGAGRRRHGEGLPRRAHRQRRRVLRRGRDRRAPRRSDQKGACERNHVEIRKLLPKGRGLRFDRLVPADLSLAMSHVNSEPRGALGFATPARAFRAMLGDDAAALLEAYGIEDVPIDELDLTPGLIARARAERGDAPLS